MATETFDTEPPNHRTIVLGASGILTEVIVEGCDSVTITPNAAAFIIYGEEALTLADGDDGALVDSVPLTADFGNELSILGNHFGARPTWRCLIGSLSVGAEVLIEVERRK